jgi:hypothetical protein
MNKKRAHIIVVLADLFCLAMIWMGVDDLQQINMKISNHVDVISYGNRIGYFVVGIGGPLIHLLIILEHSLPNIVHKAKGIMNYIIIVLVAALLSTGFIICSQIETKLENAGYVYCRNASGISALAKTVVYTKSIKSCNDLEK